MTLRVDPPTSVSSATTGLGPCASSNHWSRRLSAQFRSVCGPVSAADRPVAFSHARAGRPLRVVDHRAAVDAGLHARGQEAVDGGQALRDVRAQAVRELVLARRRNVELDKGSQINYSCRFGCVVLSAGVPVTV